MFTGKIVGVVLYRLFVFLRISTFRLSPSNLKSRSLTSFLVLPSITIKAGGVLYPLPTEVIPIVSSPVNGSRVKICGKRALGLNVLSVG